VMVRSNNLIISQLDKRHSMSGDILAQNHSDSSPLVITLEQRSSTFFSPRPPWLRETLSRDPHPRRPKFGPDIYIIYLELSVSHIHTHTHTPLQMFEHNCKSSVTHNSFQFILFIIEIFSPLQLDRKSTRLNYS